MSYLIVAATVLEIAPFLDHLRNARAPGPETDILITGPGLTAATWAITHQVHTKRPELIIQAGVAGCFDKSISLGSVLAIRRELVADQVAEEKNQLKTVFDLGLAKPNQYPYKKGWLVNQSAFFKKTRLKKVTAISVNEISTSRKRISLYREKYDPVTESMEGAALHYVCLMEKIPFLQLRAVSNYVGERNKRKWELEYSIQQLNKALLTLLK